MADSWLSAGGNPSDVATQVGNDSSLRPDISADGRFVAFRSSADNLVPGDTNQATDVFVKDLWLGTIQIASATKDGTQGDRSVSPAPPSISGDGRYVAFSSRATNLVAKDENATADIFVKDLLSGNVRLVSGAADGESGNDAGFRPTISADGRFVAFQSYAVIWSSKIPTEMVRTYSSKTCKLVS